MKLSCNLYVDGEFEGSINSSKEINVGKHGHIKGDIVTNRLIVQGFVEGTVNAAKVKIKSVGKVSGSIESSELIIESQGIFEGTSVVKKTSNTTNKPKEISKKS
jgi:cytoskeletal protein CcmA (bactofilin family)